MYYLLILLFLLPIGCAEDGQTDLGSHEFVDYGYDKLSKPKRPKTK